MRILSAIALFVSVNAAAIPVTDIVVADFNNDYEHSYKTCTVASHEHLFGKGYLFAICKDHTAPSLEVTMERRKEYFYNEVWINGVHWDNCVVAYHETHGNYREFFRFECNRSLTPEWMKQTWYID
jgi:hypothetical protein